MPTQLEKTGDKPILLPMVFRKKKKAVADENQCCYRDFGKESMGEGRRKEFHSGAQWVNNEDLPEYERLMEKLFGRYGVLFV